MLFVIIVVFVPSVQVGWLCWQVRVGRCYLFGELDWILSLNATLRCVERWSRQSYRVERELIVFNSGSGSTN